MERNDPPHPRKPDAGGADPLDALRRLEERLDRASTAAERLIAEADARAAGSAAGARGAPEREAEGAPPDRAGGPHPPPPAGWQTPGEPERPDSELLMQVLSALRDLLPPELERRLAEALRELLLALRALIDWYLERAERRRTEPAEVQDIPIN